MLFRSKLRKISITLSSLKSATSLTLDDKMEERKINNFHKLFSIIVQFPFLRPFTKTLISLPLSFLYTWIYFAFYGFKYLSHSSFKGLLLTFVHYLKFYFKYVSRLEKKIKFSKTKSVASTTIK